MLDIVLSLFVLIPLIFFVPGYLLFHIFLKEPFHDLEFSEVIFLQILGSILISGWIALALAELGYFSAFNLLIILLIICGIMSLQLNKKFDLISIKFPKFDYDILAIIILIVIAVVSFFHPAEYIFGNADAGVYVNTGVNIAKTGSIIIHDNLLKNESVNFYESFVMQSRFEEVHYTPWGKFPGFYVSDSDRGIVIPQFFHLYPSWIAIFYSIFGLKNGLYLTPLFGLLGILSIYFAGKTLFNRKIGFFAALFLATNILQIWFSRYPTSEVLTQFLFFSGMYTLFKNTDLKDSYLWTLSALSFGELFLTRIDVILFLFILFIFFGYYYIVGKFYKQMIFFVIPFTILLIHSSAHVLYISIPYAYDVFANVFSEKAVFSILIISILFIALIQLAKVHIKNYVIEKMVINQNYIKILLIITIILLSIYAFIFRPYTTDPQEIKLYGQIIRTYNEENLLRLGWYLTDLVIMLGIVGCIFLVWNVWNNRAAVFLLTGIIFSIVYIYNIMNNPHQIYAMRRYVPVVVPFFILCASYILDTIFKNKKYGRLLFIAITSLILVSYLYSDYLIINHVEYRGAIDQIDSLSKSFPENSIVIFTRNAGLLVATPVQYIYSIDSLVLQESFDKATVINAISNWIAEGKNVYVFSGGEDTGIFETLSFNPVTQGIISTPVLERSYEHKPSKIITDQVPYWIYKIENLNKTKEPFFLDIGYFDYGRMEGFYGAEQNQEINFRWTSKFSSILLPTDFSKNNSISIRMGAARPMALPPEADLVLHVDDHTLGNLSIGNEFNVYSIAVPSEFTINNDQVKFTIETVNTWKPSEILNSTDSRELGVVMDWVRIDKDIS